jgi:transcriptional regulator with XRE-family HTH domain
MNELLTPSDIERLAKEAGIPIGDVCRRAGIAQSTWSRWKRGKTNPRMDVYMRLRDVVAPRVEAA